MRVSSLFISAICFINDCIKLSSVELSALSRLSTYFKNATSSIPIVYRISEQTCKYNFGCSKGEKSVEKRGYSSYNINISCIIMRNQQTFGEED